MGDGFRDENEANRKVGPANVIPFAESSATSTTSPSCSGSNKVPSSPWADAADERRILRRRTQEVGQPEALLHLYGIVTLTPRVGSEGFIPGRPRALRDQERQGP